jgi:hypothetical protein
LTSCYLKVVTEKINMAGQPEPIDRLTRAVELLLKLKAEELRGNRTQKEMIHLLANVGATGAEVASILGISTTIVHPEMSRARAAKGRVRSGRSGNKR